MHPTELFVILFTAGLATGIYSSVVGGGAIFLIPLLTLLGLPLISAIATLRLSAVATQIVTVGAFWRKGVVEWRSALWLSLCCLPGAYAGAFLVLHLDQQLLARIVAVLMVALLLASYGIRRPSSRSKHKRQPTSLRWLTMAVISFVLGIYGGFYGAGFSTIVMLSYLLVIGTTFLAASANASVVTVFMSIAASLSFLRSGTIDWPLLLPLTIGGAIGALIGVSSAVRFGGQWIRILLGIVVVLSVVKLLIVP